MFLPCKRTQVTGALFRTALAPSGRCHVSGGAAPQPKGYDVGCEHGHRARTEHGTETSMSCDCSECGTSKSHRKIEAPCIKPHRKPPVLRGDAAHGFDAETWINQRVAKSRETGAKRCSQSSMR